MLIFFKRNLQKFLRWDMGRYGSRVLIEAVMIILICANNQTSCPVKTGM